MSIAGILSSAFSSHQLGATSSPLQQQLQQLGQALQSGNLTAAQSDFATLRQAFSQPSTTVGPSSGATSTTATPVSQDFNQLASDLQSGNLAAAQKDLSAIQQGIQSPNGTPSYPRFAHGHHHGGGPSSAMNSLLQDLNEIGSNQVGQGTPSSTLAGAQAAYGLQQQLQQFALGGGALASESPLSLDA